MNDPRGIQTHDHSFEDDGRIPNNPTLPLLVYPQALSEAERETSRCRVLLAKNGWGGAWVDGIFPYHHYHSVSHEVLCVVGVAARVTFGGPEGETLEVRAGDVVVIPARVGHCNDGSSGASRWSQPARTGRKTTTCAQANPANDPGCWRTSATSRCRSRIPSSAKKDRYSGTGYGSSLNAEISGCRTPVVGRCLRGYYAAGSANRGSRLSRTSTGRSRWILPNSLTSASPTSVTATPSLPARAVRPMR